VHPSSILREPDSHARREAMRAFVRDLEKVAVRLKAEPTSRNGNRSVKRSPVPVHA
jgi:hypothetical protein